MLDADRDLTKYLTHQMLKHQDITFASSLMVAGVWDTDLLGVDGSVALNAGEFVQFNSTATLAAGNEIDPLSVFEDAADAMHRKTGFRPDTLVLGREVLSTLKKDPRIQSLTLYNPTSGITGGSDKTLAAVSQYIDIPQDRIVVIDTVYHAGDTTTLSSNNASAGNVTGRDGLIPDLGAFDTANNLFIGGKDCLMMYSGPNGGKYAPQAAVKAQWTGLFPGNEMGNVKVNYSLAA